MLEAGDRLVLADGVVLRDGALIDSIGQSSWPVNATAAFVLEPSGRMLGEVADDVAAAFALTAETARDDVLAFAWQLNRLALANVEHRGGRIRHAFAWLRLAARLAPAGAMPPPTARRRQLDTRTVAGAFGSAAKAGAGRATALALMAAITIGHVGLVAGSPTLLMPLVAGLATGGGVVLHEAAHAAALVGVPSALVVRGRRVYVLHAPAGARRRVLVAVAGPGASAALGSVLLAVAFTLGAPMLALAGGPAAAHAVGLSVLASDGRTACGL